jgi:hypothetical protein
MLLFDFGDLSEFKNVLEGANLLVGSVKIFSKSWLKVTV